MNEGNFQLGNASVDVFDKTTGSISRSVFQSSNDRPLGDIAQSMLIDADTGYIVINNSGKVEKGTVAIYGVHWNIGWIEFPEIYD